MKDAKKWFVAKRYGWGWTPGTWQGWLVSAVWLIAFLGLIAWIEAAMGDTTAGLAWSLIVGFGLTAIFLIIVYRTGEAPAWNWGDKKNKK